MFMRKACARNVNGLLFSPGAVVPAAIPDEKGTLERSKNL